MDKPITVSPDLKLIRLASRARVLFYMQAFARLVLFWIPFTTVAATAAAVFGSALWSALGAMGWLFFLFIIALWWPTLSWQRWGYALRGDDLLIARGVLIRSVTAIPTHRIQHVDTRQGPLEQWLVHITNHNKCAHKLEMLSNHVAIFAMSLDGRIAYQAMQFKEH